MAGKRTSFYLTDDRAEALMKAGINLLDAFDAGILCCLGKCGRQVPQGKAGTTPARQRVPQARAAQPGSVGTAERRTAAAEGKPLDRLGEACPHPRARVLRGLCMACGEAVPSASNGKQAASG